jgi:hypothetical protein
MIGFNQFTELHGTIEKPRGTGMAKARKKQDAATGASATPSLIALIATAFRASSRFRSGNSQEFLKDRSVFPGALKVPTDGELTLHEVTWAIREA